MILQKSSLYNFYVIAILLCSVHFYGLFYRISPYTYQLLDVLYYSLLAVLIILSISKKIHFSRFNSEQRVVHYLLLFLFLFLVISALSATFFHQQSFLRTLLGMRYFSYLLIFYVLVFLNVDKKFVLKLFAILAVIYMIVFSVQYMIFPVELVPINNIKDFDRGLLRFRIEGVGFMTIIGFFCLNKYLKINKIKYLLYFSVCLIFVFLLGFRTLLVAYLCGSMFILIISKKALLYKVNFILFLLFLVSVGWLFGGLDDYFYNVIELSKSQMQQEEDYIRFRTFNFLFNNVNVNFLTLLVGNGMPIDGTSYGSLVLGYGSQKNGFVSADLGMLGFSFNYGIISALIVYLFIICISFFSYKNEDYYIVGFSIYLLLSSFTTAEIFRAGMFGILVTGAYLSTVREGES